MATQITAGPQPTAAPLSLANTSLEPITPLSISATFDGSGAGADFMPCVSFYTTDGRLIGRFQGEATVTAGDTAQETFAPFLSKRGSGAGIQFDKDPQDGDWLFVHTTGTNPSTGDSTDFEADGHYQVTADGRIRLDSIDDFSARLVAFFDAFTGNHYGGVFVDSSLAELLAQTSGSHQAFVVADNFLPQVRIGTTSATNSGAIAISTDTMGIDVLSGDLQVTASGDVALHGGGVVLDGVIDAQGGAVSFTLPASQTWELRDHNGVVKWRWTEGTTVLHGPTGGSIVFDL